MGFGGISLIDELEASQRITPNFCKLKIWGTIASLENPEILQRKFRDNPDEYAEITTGNFGMPTSRDQYNCYNFSYFI